MWTYLLSWFLVAFGTPSLLPWLMPLAALGGYALFWRSIAQVQSRFTLSFIWFFFVGLVHFSWIATTTYNGPPHVDRLPLCSGSAGGALWPGEQVFFTRRCRWRMDCR